jgi:quercetin 2,3-dioxygenase
MMTLRKSAERGHAEHGWLKSQHTFSFADYHDPMHMGFRSLRVINEDRVAPAQGFSTHGHTDMEIISYVLEGGIEHKDSMGNGSVIKPGEVQYMSAGSGVRHSEFNPSPSQEAHFLQIWIKPNERGVTPRYDQRPFPHSGRKNAWRTLVVGEDIATADERAEVILIRQDARLWGTVLEAGRDLKKDLAPDRGYWLQVVKGAITVTAKDGTVRDLSTGDALAIEGEPSLTLSASAESELLLFDLK